MKKLLFLGIVTMIILASLVTGCTDNGDENGEEEEELEEAPDFTLKSTDNDYFSLSDFSNKIVILDFMFLACNPCMIEMGHLENVSLEYSSNKVKIISIDIDYVNENETELRTFKEKNGYEWIFAMDTEIEDVKSKYQASAFPTLVIVNKEGKIAHKHIGITDYDTLSSEIDDLM